MYMEAASTARTVGGTRIRLALTILWGLGVAKAGVGDKAGDGIGGVT